MLDIDGIIKEWGLCLHKWMRWVIGVRLNGSWVAEVVWCCHLNRSLEVSVISHLDGPLRLDDLRDLGHLMVRRLWEMLPLVGLVVAIEQMDLTIWI